MAYKRARQVKAVKSEKVTGARGRVSDYDPVYNQCGLPKVTSVSRGGLYRKGTAIRRGMTGARRKKIRGK